MAYRFRSALFALDAETAHRATMRALSAWGAAGAPFASPSDSDESLRVRVAGIDFPNPVGLAAGLDKDAEAVAGLFALGFGAVEVGTARLRVGGSVPRCAAVTRNPEGGERDKPVVNAIKAYRGVQATGFGQGVPFGVYADVVQNGVVRVGDELRVTSRSDEA